MGAISFAKLTDCAAQALATASARMHEPNARSAIAFDIRGTARGIPQPYPIGSIIERGVQRETDSRERARGAHGKLGIALVSAEVVKASGWVAEVYWKVVC